MLPLLHQLLLLQCCQPRLLTLLVAKVTLRILGGNYHHVYHDYLVARQHLPLTGY